MEQVYYLVACNLAGERFRRRDFCDAIKCSEDVVHRAAVDGDNVVIEAAAPSVGCYSLLVFAIGREVVEDAGEDGFQLRTVVGIDDGLRQFVLCRCARGEEEECDGQEPQVERYSA